MKPFFLILGLVGILILVGFFIILPTGPQNKSQIMPSPTAQIQKSTDAKAAFAILTNGTFRVFTAAMYHNLSSDVYIESSNPNIVHVKKSGVTWDNFFKTLPFSLTKECLTTGTGETFCTGKSGTLKFYLNENRDDDLLSKPINPFDKVLITFGTENGSQIQNQIQKVPDPEN